MHNFSKTHGLIGWMELMSEDVKESKEFYGKLFDWEYVDSDNLGFEYTMIKHKGSKTPIAGLYDKKLLKKISKGGNTEEAAPNWGNYITVSDVAKTVSLAKEMDAEILEEPTELPNVGMYARIKDPQGAVFMIIEYNQNIGEFLNRL